MVLWCAFYGLLPPFGCHAPLFGDSLRSAVIHELLQARADPDRAANTRSTPLPSGGPCPSPHAHHLA